MQSLEFQNATLALSIRSLDHIPLHFHDTSNIIRSLQISREDIYYNAAVSYMAWWLPYAGWLLTIGMTAPKRGYVPWRGVFVMP